MLLPAFPGNKLLRNNKEEAMRKCEETEKSFDDKTDEKNFTLNHVELLLEDVVKKLEFANTLQKIYEEDFEKIKSPCTTSEMYILQKVFEKYTGENNYYHYEMFSQIEIAGDTSEFFNKYQNRTILPSKRFDSNVNKAFQICYEKPTICSLSTICYHQGIASEEETKFLEGIQLLFSRALDEIKMTPDEEFRKEEQLRKIFLHTEKFLADCHEEEFFAYHHNSEESDTLVDFDSSGKSFDKNYKEIEFTKNEIESIKEHCQDYIKQLENDCKNMMITEWNISKEKQDAIIEECELESCQLEKVRNDHSEMEKVFRTKRLKTEEQLLALLGQYKKEMLDRQNRYNEKQKKFEKGESDYNKLKTKYDEQTLEYDVLMAEKKKYEEKMIEARMYELRCKMAARRIQKFFRKFRQVLRIQAQKDRQKKDKGKKKKKN